MTNEFTTREAWLTAAVDHLRPWFDAADSPLVTPVRVTIGFPSTNALGMKTRRHGECWSASASSSGHAEIFITPLLDSPTEILGVLAHELCHAALPDGVGHKKPFARLAAKMSLVGKATQASAGEEFIERSSQIIEALGPLPHAKLMLIGKEKKPRKTAYLKCQCGVCGYAAWTTKKWVTVGAPVCPTDNVPLTCDAIDEEEGGDC